MTRNSRLKITITFLLLMLSSWTAKAVEFRIKNECTVAGGLVRLGDLVDVEEASAAETVRLVRVELFAAPSPGSSRTVRASEIRELLTLRGMDASSFRTVGPDIVTVRRASLSKEPQTTIHRKTEVQLQEKQLVAVAKRTLLRGETLRKGDVELRAVNKPLPGFEFVRDVADTYGRETSRQVEAGQPVDARWLQQPLLVRRNEVISIVSRAAGVQVKTSAKATEDGTHGEVITVETLEKGKRHRFTARITGLQEAEVFAGVQTVSSP